MSDFAPAPGAAPWPRRLRAHTTVELRTLLRNGEQLLLTIGIPTILLVVFTKAPIADVPKPRVDFLVPGVLALAVMSTAFTGQAIATGFERRYAVLRRLGTTPLGRPTLLAAKTAAVIGVELLQIAVLCAVGLILGWSPHGNPLNVVGLLLLGTVAFSALGLLLAGVLRAEATLAAANLVYLLMLVFGGVASRLSVFWLPLASLAHGLRATTPTARDWLVLAAWAVGASILAARFFRWD